MRTLKAIITARNEESDLNIRAEIECREDRVDSRRSQIEDHLSGFVAGVAKEFGLDFKHKVTWRERGNRNRLREAPRPGGGGPKSNWEQDKANAGS